MENKNSRIIHGVIGVLGALFGVMNAFGLVPEVVKTPAVYGGVMWIGWCGDWCVFWDG